MAATVATILDLFREAHRQIRENLQGVEPAALNWVPGPDTSSIAILVTHMLGSEGETLRVVKALPSDRVRDTEFQVRPQSVAEVLRHVDAADRLLDEIGGTIGDADLEASRSRMNRPPQTGLFHLLRSYGHVREHTAHLELTKQLYDQRSGRSA